MFFFFIKKKTLAEVFSCEFCEISKNTFFTEDLRTTASKFFISQFKSLRVLFNIPQMYSQKDLMQHYTSEGITQNDEKGFVVYR